MREKNVAEVGKRVGSEGRKGFFSCRLLSLRFSAGRAQPPVACDSHFNSEPPGGSWFSFPMMEHQPSSSIHPLSLSLPYALSLSLFLPLSWSLSPSVLRSPLSFSLLVFVSFPIPPLGRWKSFQRRLRVRGRSGMNRTVCRLSRLSHRESNKSRPDGWGMNRARLISAKERRLFLSLAPRKTRSDLDLRLTKKLGKFF